MNTAKTFNVYCDESCHLERDGIPVMAWGALSCPAAETRDIAETLRALKTEYALAPKFEAKWTKVSPAKTEFYLALVNTALNDDRLRFRGLVVPDKKRLHHARFNQSHDDWYYKMYFTMLKPIFRIPHHYHIYLDMKDTQGDSKTRRLHEVLANSHYDFHWRYVERVQQIRSHESELLQITDVLTGALTYANRGLDGNQAKTAIIRRLHEHLGVNALTSTSAFAAAKFNILVWQAQEMAAE